jgi:hypothetical protein
MVAGGYCPNNPFPANMSRNYYLPPHSPFSLCTVTVVWREGIMVAGGYCPPPPPSQLT